MGRSFSPPPPTLALECMLCPLPPQQEPFRRPSGQGTGRNRVRAPVVYTAKSLRGDAESYLPSTAGLLQVPSLTGTAPPPSGIVCSFFRLSSSPMFGGPFANQHQSVLSLPLPSPEPLNFFFFRHPCIEQEQGLDLGRGAGGGCG